MADKIQIRRDTAANWSSNNPVLSNGEMGWETDTGVVKMGDGSTAYNTLAKLIPGNRRALVHRASDQTAANYSSNAAIPFDSETSGYDTGGWHDNSTNNTRLTVPSGVTRARFGGTLRISSVTSGTRIVAFIGKNGANMNYGQPIYDNVVPSTTTIRFNFVSSILNVTGGDYFEFFLQLITDTSITVVADQTCFWAEEW